MHDEHHIVLLCREILSTAIHKNATDIHIEPGSQHTQIRFRIDGVLATYRKINIAWHDHLIAHIKVQASLDIAEKRLPQDGRFNFQSNGIHSICVDCRASTIPTLNGEKIVLRILQQSNKPLSISNLGFNLAQLKLVHRAIENPQGLILVTGPTGSGKTVTLYSCLAHLNDGSRNISSVEDPVEIKLDGINQVAINEKSGLNYSMALRALLRQDPDILLIGEIRDCETAKIAVQASQTGHLVLASLHTNDAVSAISRMIGLGCEKDLLMNCLTLITAQRLLRKICTKCKCQPKFCSACDQTGYKGRIAVHEVLAMNKQLSQQIIQSNEEINLYALAEQFGMTSLAKNTQELIKLNITNLAEAQKRIGNVCA